MTFPAGELLYRHYISNSYLKKSINFNFLKKYYNQGCLSVEYIYCQSSTYSRMRMVNYGLYETTVLSV